MDQIVVDCGPDGDVSVGDEVVLIGRQGPGSLTVADWAEVLGTIGNEVLTEIGSRVPRVVVDTDPPAGRPTRRREHEQARGRSSRRPPRSGRGPRGRRRRRGRGRPAGPSSTGPSPAPRPRPRR